MWYTIDSDNRSTLDICDEEVHKQEEMLAEDEEEEQSQEDESVKDEEEEESLEDEDEEESVEDEEDESSEKDDENRFVSDEILTLSLRRMCKFLTDRVRKKYANVEETHRKVDENDARISASSQSGDVADQSERKSRFGVDYEKRERLRDNVKDYGNYESRQEKFLGLEELQLRCVLILFIPSLTPLSIFGIVNAGSPLLVLSKRSKCLFPPLFISNAMEVAYKEEMIEGENFKFCDKFCFFLVINLY